ncbi:MAG: winged helix-turn-helix transcriptional regulator [Pelotomaculum sp.]|uniref:Predicted transcriptional regulator n=1 Tax=Pelotomaculum thermopropionicum (strain DSM 13744 / JCM 10971 / SI) TaxID=370438 RepID=A5D1H1_PELTS|nr:winged helix-turn-helix transcriptional regulator [Pelotomaculum sp.]BAF59914.1 predicted transcriptional regulator [Pelotomaculum thermopropionicum SI]
MQNMKKYEEKAELLKALAHPTRLCIVHGLLENECNVNKIKECLNMPQSTVSQQLGILRSKGIIEGRRRGTEICYRVINSQVRQIVALLMKNSGE